MIFSLNFLKQEASSNQSVCAMVACAVAFCRSILIVVAAYAPFEAIAQQVDNWDSHEGVKENEASSVKHEHSNSNQEWTRKDESCNARSKVITHSEREKRAQLQKISITGISADIVPLTGHQILQFSEIKEFSKAAQKNKRTLTYFWGTWCKPCLEELPYLSQLAQNHSKELEIVGLSDGYISPSDYDEKVKEVKSLTEKYGLTQQYFTTNSDALNQIFERRISVFPALALFDKAGRLEYRSIGSIAEDAHYEKVQSFLKARGPGDCKEPQKVH